MSNEKTESIITPELKAQLDEHRKIMEATIERGEEARRALPFITWALAAQRASVTCGKFEHEGRVDAGAYAYSLAAFENAVNKVIYIGDREAERLAAREADPDGWAEMTRKGYWC
jgi:hypothetical protein